MSSIEEKLWNYIDGNCNADEQQAISLLIERDEIYRRKYKELLALNAEFSAMELDEPPMAFTYNVMEQIRAEVALKPLKTTIDTRIFKGIAAFFIMSIVALIIFALSQVDWSAGQAVNFKLPEYKMPDTAGLFSGPAFEIFLFFDVVLGLYLSDAWLRRKKAVKAV
ncbi:hypothetical protein EOD41_12970 [Mucilaginibacter limnophilus]|uniref:Zf-HC2 domain-containing protein n=1 Tax=Mucilaginibacter limnophilus TaxID=1932778 RepID=A0A437MRX7_9SPHI|nr:hypothetical protein [Mucilaginibacter limnophilus]RVU00385.1 hypothetical protein EOD41_12970 [Mucilaginibacter limnophilus]